MFFKRKLSLVFFLLIYINLNLCLSIENKDFKNYKLRFFLSNDNKFSIKNILDDKIIRGSIKGTITDSNFGIFSNTSIECDILGRSYKGRAFSCGFAEVEDLKGYCQFITSNHQDSLLTYWECSTTAGLNGDAVCKGKAKVLQGFGNLAGVIGFGEIEMPLTKTLVSEKISYPMRWTLKIKHPLALKKIN